MEEAKKYLLEKLALDNWDEIADRQCPLTYYGVAHIMQKYTEKQCAINGVGNWVAVEEKLPPKYENVIIRNENNIVSTDQISDKGWVYGELCELKVTHWQPMPKPPCC